MKKVISGKMFNTENAEEIVRWKKLYDLQMGYLLKNESFFIATYMVATDPMTGGQISACTWGRNCPSLLPRTDIVGFATVSDALANAISSTDFERLAPSDRYVIVLAVASWRRVMDVVGYRMESTDYDPPRYRVTTFPNSEEIKEMGILSGFKGVGFSDV